MELSRKVRSYKTLSFGTESAAAEESDLGVYFLHGVIIVYKHIIASAFFS